MFSVFCSKGMSKFSQVVQPSLLCCVWLFEIFLLCYWLFRTVRLQTQTVRLHAQNSAITAELLFVGTNQNAGITSDFKMDIINSDLQYRSGYFRLLTTPQLQTVN